MRATFYGFEAAKSGLTAAQAGLDITGNNIANLSTEGYSRQVVDQTETYLGSSSDKVAPVLLQSNGLGTTVQGINQMRSQFLDLRYRDANAINAANEKMRSILGDIENNFDETENDGLSAMLDDFNKQLQVLSMNAGAVEYSSLTRSSAQKVTQTFNQYSNQLAAIRKQTVDEMEISVGDANTLLNKIATINTSIKSATLHGTSTNELNDSRNLYLDKLSKYMNIKATYHDDGTVSVSSGSTTLLDATAGSVATLAKDDAATGMRLLADGSEMTLTGGSLFGSMQVLNGKGSFAASGENDYRGLPYYQASLDALANSLTTTFNSLNGTGKPLFTSTGAADIAITSQWLANPNYITATLDADGAKGKNDNILRMVDAMDMDRSITPDFTGSFNGFLLSAMSDIAIDVDYTTDVSETSDMVLRSVGNERESTMGVSLNEETTNLIRYQKAFAASARVMTALDEALEIVINRMGTVGR
jgi:flagellar hook-associated protein 1 FlgK